MIKVLCGFFSTFLNFNVLFIYLSHETILQPPPPAIPSTASSHQSFGWNGSMSGKIFALDLSSGSIRFMKALRRLCEVTRFPPLVAFRHASEDAAAFCVIWRISRSSSARYMDRPRRPFASASRLTISAAICLAFSSSVRPIFLAVSPASVLAFSSATFGDWAAAAVVTEEALAAAVARGDAAVDAATDREAGCA